MQYVPQYSDKTPPDFIDEEFSYYFDQNTTPGLVLNLAVGEEALQIPLQLQADAEFHCRGIQITDATGTLAVRLYDPSHVALSADYLPVNLSYGFEQAGNPGQCPTVFEPAMVYPAGSVVLIDVKRLA